MPDTRARRWRPPSPGPGHGHCKSRAAATDTASSSCPSPGSLSGTLAWISRCRGLARDYERHTRTATAFVRIAMIRLMLRRLSASS